MADISGDTGAGLDVRPLISGTDIVGVFPSGNFYVTGSVNSVNIGSKSWVVDTIPTNENRNNPSWKFEYDGDGNLGSIVQTIDTGSYVQKLTWANGSVLTNIGEWV